MPLTGALLSGINFERKCILPLPPGTEIVRRERVGTDSWNFYYHASRLRPFLPDEDIYWVCRVSPGKIGAAGEPIERVDPAAFEPKPSLLAEIFTTPAGEFQLPGVGPIGEPLKKAFWAAAILLGLLAVISVARAVR